MKYDLRFKNKTKNSGQVAIIVLLISAVAMTIGLSVSKKTVNEIRIDTDEEQLKQAFNAAESGLEYYLKTRDTNYVASDNSSAVIDTTPIGGGSNRLDFGRTTLNNRTTFFWLIAHKIDGTLDVTNYYGGNILNICSSVSTGALKVDYFYREGGNYKVWRQGYNLSSGAISGFTDITLNSGCFGLTGIPLVAPGRTPVLIAVRPIGMSTDIVLTGDQQFVVQGEEISSIGKVGDSGHSVSQVAKIFSQYSVPVFMLDAVTADNILSN